MDKEKTMIKETIGKVVFTIDANGELVEVKNKGKRKSIVIPSRFESGTRITSIGSEVCKGKFSEITISDDIEKVDEDAFVDSDIERVIWSSGCKEIPRYCFAGSKIQSISNIENVEEIGEKAFYWTASLKEFTWPDACNSIPAGCFNCCLSLNKIHNINHVVRIGTEAFKSCIIPEIVWPSKCPVIPIGCFEDSRLRKISNIDAVTEIEEGAFKDCDIEKFKWPSGCKIIPGKCFVGSQLEKISGIEDVECIGEYAFKRTFLKAFKWPEKCKRVPRECFSGCDLTSISGLNDVEEIKSGAFRNSKIQSFNWPPKCEAIPAYCFSDSELKHISNIESIHSIGEYAFFRAENIDGINLEDSTVATIECGAFAYMEEKVTFPYYMSHDAIAEAFKEKGFEEFDDYPSGTPW